MQKASQKFKKPKATGPGEVHVEYLKYGSNQLFANMSDILNKTSEIGKYPEDVRLGTPNPLVKPWKKNEEVNVRPIILLSPLRKILTTSLIDRCCDRMKKQIPLSQASYQSGRSTTEQGFTIKTLADKKL